MFGGKGKSGGRQKLKLTNIVESIDVGVPVRVAYDQWTTYDDFPTFMKKVENVEPDEDDQARSTGRRRSSGRTGSGKPRSSTSGQTSGSCGSPRARRATSTAR